MPDALPDPRTAEASRPAWRRVRDVALVLLACVLVHWTGLSIRGFSDSEGHRVGPGWELVERGWNGSWVVPHLFEQSYIRKPPGMPWAVAASAWAFGMDEHSARGVSAAAATLLALGAMAFAARWFGWRAALPAGLAAALWPMMVAPGRTAEIEAINNLCSAAGVWLAVELLVRPGAWGRGASEGAGRRGPAATLALAAGLGVAIAATGVVKGPAGLPVIAAAIAASAWLGVRAGDWRGAGGVLALAIAVALAVPAGAWGWMAWQAARDLAAEAARSGMEPVRQGVGEFLWAGGPVTLGRVWRVATMPVAAIGSGAPVGALAIMALLVRGGELGSGGQASGQGDDRARRAARAVALGTLVSLVGMAIAGVHNPRYAQPSLAPLPVLAVVAGPLAMRLMPRLGRGGLVRGAWIVAGALLLACVGLGPVRDALRSPTNSGRAAGVELGRAMPDGAEVWAGDAVEARPEVLLYARREAARLGRAVRPVWRPALTLPPAGGLVLLREDAHSGEAARAREWDDRLEPLARGRAHIFEFGLYRVAR